MKRLGLPEELAAANCYFLSGQSGFTTGQTLFVDGGYMTGKSAL
jgi:NAD(P)-dependent dehydrogenase (short-subunit alcohol dehydrogenase family)